MDAYHQRLYKNKNNKLPKTNKELEMIKIDSQRNDIEVCTYKQIRYFI